MSTPTRIWPFRAAVARWSVSARGRDREPAGGAPADTRLRRWALVMGPAVLAGLLAGIDLDARSLWLDEAATVSIASQHGAALGSAMARDGGNMLGYYALIHVLIGWFGSGVVVLRLPSVIGCAATTALVVVLARRLFTARIALVAGLLSAVSLPAVYWAQNIRSYALMMAFVTASYVAFLALTDRRPEGPASLRAAAAYVVVTTLALYMSFVAVLVIAAQLVALAGNRRRARPAVFSMVAVAVLCSPLAWLAHSRGAGQLFWESRPDLGTLGTVVTSLTSAGYPPDFFAGVPGIVLAVVTTAAFAGAIWFVLWRLVADRSADRVRGELVVVCWLVVPPVVSFVESRLAQPTFSARNLLVSLPAAAIVLARVVCDRRLPRLAFAGLFAGIVGVRAYQLVPSYGVSPENWQATTLYVLKHARPGDCIAFYPSDGRMAFTYYLTHGPAVTAFVPRPVLPSTPLREVLPYVERYTTLDHLQLDRIAAECPRLWLVASHEGSRGGTRTSRVNYAKYLRLAGNIGLRYPTTTVRTHGWASPITVWLYGPVS